MYEFSNPKKIAILMATYNAQKYLAAQIDSILAQSNNDWTLYIRDDGSDDNTIQIINTYLSMNNNIVLLQDNKGNLKCRDNFYELLNRVDSQYYMFSDADDVWLIDKVDISLRKMIEVEELNPDKPIIVHTDLFMVDENLNIINESMWKISGVNPDKIKSFNYLAINMYVGGATMLFNNAAKIVSFPINNMVKMHDAWISMCVIRTGIIASVHISTMLYRQHASNTFGGAKADNLTLKNKIKNFRKVFAINLDTYRTAKACGYGSFIKYIYYKMKLTIMIRQKKMFS